MQSTTQSLARRYYAGRASLIVGAALLVLSAGCAQATPATTMLGVPMRPSMADPDVPVPSNVSDVVLPQANYRITLSACLDLPEVLDRLRCSFPNAAVSTYNAPNSPAGMLVQAYREILPQHNWRIDPKTTSTATNAADRTTLSICKNGKWDVVLIEPTRSGGSRISVLGGTDNKACP